MIFSFKSSACTIIVCQQIENHEKTNQIHVFPTEHRPVAEANNK